jgi:GNAT superfamily N-acetyltransferase
MNEIKIIPIKPNEIELKYNNTQFPLIFEYIGPDRTHGDQYYQLNWYEILYNYNVAGISCLGDSKYVPKALHISVFEIYEKNKGIGTKTIDFLVDFAKSLKYNCITLQAYDERAKIFYLKLGFIQRLVNGTPFLIKYL